MITVCVLKVHDTSVGDTSLSERPGESSTWPTALTISGSGPPNSLAGMRKLVPGSRGRLYQRRRPPQKVASRAAAATTLSATTGSSRAAMLGMIEREGPGETALHKATRLGYEVSSLNGQNTRKWESDNDNVKQYYYTCIITNQPDAKSNPNC